MIKIKTNIKQSDRKTLEPGAQFVRQIFVNGRAYTQKQKVEQESRLRKRFLVKGRIESGRRLWDVYALDGNKRPTVVGAGFIFQEEAISFARDKSLGRESVSFRGGVRGVFNKGSGGLLLQSKSIEKPNENIVKIQATKNGVIVG